MDMNTMNTTNVIAGARYELLRTTEGSIPRMKITLTDAEGNKVAKGYLIAPSGAIVSRFLETQKESEIVAPQRSWTLRIS